MKWSFKLAGWQIIPCYMCRKQRTHLPLWVRVVEYTVLHVYQTEDTFAPMGLNFKVVFSFTKLEIFGNVLIEFRIVL